jgi:hypothetical protein
MVVVTYDDLSTYSKEIFVRQTRISLTRYPPEYTYWQKKKKVHYFMIEVQIKYWVGKENQTNCRNKQLEKLDRITYNFILFITII